MSDKTGMFGKLKAAGEAPAKAGEGDARWPAPLKSDAANHEQIARAAKAGSPGQKKKIHVPLSSVFSGPDHPDVLMKFSKYYLAAVSAFAIWGFFTFALKPLQNFRSIDILFYRVFFCAIVMLVINLGFRRSVLKDNYRRLRQMPPRQQRTMLLLTCGGGALLAANWFFFIYVMNHISIKAASFAYLVCPILTTVLAYFILKEQLSRWQWAAVAMSLISCLILSFHNMADIGYSLIVAMTYALYLISQRKQAGFDKFLVLSVQLIFSALLLLPFFPAYGTVIANDPVFIVRVLIIALVFTILPLYLNLYALQGLKSSTMGILLYINPLLNFAIALLYYQESISQTQIIAYLLILLSILLFNESHIRNRLLKRATS